MNKWVVFGISFFGVVFLYFQGFDSFYEIHWRAWMVLGGILCTKVLDWMTYSPLDKPIAHEGREVWTPLQRQAEQEKIQQQMLDDLNKKP
jgi:hypothetical protein